MRGNLVGAVAAACAVWAALAVGCFGTGAETCDNGTDDNGDGLVDCADPLCAAAPACPGDAGNPCTAQAGCVRESWFKDRPLDQCLAGQCTSPGEGLAVKLEVDTSAHSGMPYKVNSMSTRFISRKGLDGSAVGCALLGSLATETLATDGGATQLDATGKLNYLAYEVTRVDNGTPGLTLTNPFIYTAAGADFVIWHELWTVPPDSNSGQPQGLRKGWGCFEAGDAVAPLLPEQDCSPDAGTGTSCRTIRIKMPRPN
ncbi:MAG: hypothetical protein FJ086_10275 [Deltaproteobacteria bacterium]|nr:hypothetical protein [Deltaproteobacteria bacterium]